MTCRMHLIAKQTLRLRGNVIPPGSKSQSIRGILFALLARGESTIHHILDSEDTKAAIRICKAFGAEVNLSKNSLSIKSNGLPLLTTSTEIHSGNSGITTLFSLPLLGLRKNYSSPIILNCGEQMRARPIKPLIDALVQLGMHIHYTDKNFKLPVMVTGQLEGGSAEVDGINSQYLSALLISLPCAKRDSLITVKHLHERPYVNMTLDLLNQQRIVYTHEKNNNIDTFYIKGNQRYTPIYKTIKGDFSSASCFLAASALIPGDIELQGLDYEDCQGDKKLITILKEMGATIVIEPEKIKVTCSKPLTGICIDANEIPDLVPALAVIATQAAGKTKIYNVKQARIKETDRIHSMTNGLQKMGATIEEHEDGMTIYQSKLHGAYVQGFGDHRTVMALTLAGIIASGVTIISNGEAINKTYPTFINAMQAIGANVRYTKLLSTHHIILMGFKHVGKSSIGRCLAKRLNKKFIDIDIEVEKLYIKNHNEVFTCRQIMQLHGESYYRELEASALQQVLKFKSCVISLGGGTPIPHSNQEMIKSHTLIHVIASPRIVFERIMATGSPPFFGSQNDPYESFSRLWEERNQIYKRLATFSIDNNNTIAQAVNDALTVLFNLNKIINKKSEYSNGAFSNNEFIK